MFPLDSIMYEGMGLPFNQTDQPLYLSWCRWCRLFRLMLVASKLVSEEALVYSQFIYVLWFRYGLHLVLFWLYALFLAIYMRNFAYLCIMVWIHMDAHEYRYNFSKFQYFMYFWWTSFMTRFWSGSNPVMILEVNRFDLLSHIL